MLPAKDLAIYKQTDQSVANIFLLSKSGYRNNSLKGNKHRMISTAAARTAYSKLELWDFNASSDLPKSVSSYL